jgi:DNA-binding transcriptional MerR regulator
MSTEIQLPASIDLSSTQLEELGELLFRKDYTSEALDFIQNTARTLNYWGSDEERNLLPPYSGTDKRRKYSFADLVWLGLVKELRDFGLEKDAIYTFKGELFGVPDYQKLNQQITRHRKEVEKVLAQHYGTSVTEIKQMLDQFSERQEAIKKLQFTRLYNYLFYYFSKKAPFHLLVNKEGRHYPFYQSDFAINLESEDFLQFFNHSHLSIALSDIIASFLTSSLVKDELKQRFFTAKEWKLIELIRSERPDAVTIVDIDGKEEKIAVSKQVYVTLEHRLSELITKGAYETIVIKTQNGKPVSCKRTKLTKP